MFRAAVMWIWCAAAGLATEGAKPGAEAAAQVPFTPRWVLLGFGFRECPAQEIAEGRFLVQAEGGRYEITRDNPGLSRVKPITEEQARELLAAAATIVATRSQVTESTTPESAATTATTTKAAAPSPLARQQAGWRKTADQERAALVLAQAACAEQISDLGDQIALLGTRQTSLENVLRDLRLQETQRQRYLLLLQQRRDPDPQPEGSKDRPPARPQPTISTEMPTSNLLQQAEISYELRRVERQIIDLVQQRTAVRQRRTDLTPLIAAKEAYIAELDQALAKP